MKSKKMSKKIAELTRCVNMAMQFGTLEENKKLYAFWDSILLSKNMYHGFNYFEFMEVDGKKILTLADNKTHIDSEGFFRAKQTDIIQFYIVEK